MQRQSYAYKSNNTTDKLSYLANKFSVLDNFWKI